MKKSSANYVIKNKVIYIAGMHRSGTSMVSRMLIECGLYTGPPTKIIPPGPDNSAGFWENIDFVNLNENSSPNWVVDGIIFLTQLKKDGRMKRDLITIES